METGQRGVASAEIVDGQLNAEVLQRDHHRLVISLVAEQNALGDLEYKLRRVTPVDANTSATWPTNEGSPSCRPEPLTAIRGVHPKVQLHVTAWRHASSRTHSPMATTSPDSLAMGMKSNGGMVPRSGWSQRNSASNPTSARSSAT